ncbi:MAG: Hsp33 family molecular chaperone HslO [Longimicrobiales bacterium]
MKERNDYLVRATALEGRVRALAIDATGVVGELHARHGTEPAVTAALGRLATAALLLGAQLKDETHTVSLRVLGDGPAGTLIATSNGRGDVRGLVAHPQTGTEQVKNGKLNVSGVVGTRGRLTVTRDIGMRQPYVGVVELLSGEIGEDIAHYLVSSEQTPSAVGIGVFVDAYGRVEAAGGWMVQLLPGVSDRDANTIEERVRELPHPTTMLRSGDAPEDVLTRIFGDAWDSLDRVPVRFHCPCSIERVERALFLLGEAELRSLVEKDRRTGFTEITCEFCGRQYTLETAAMRALAEAAEALHDTGPDSNHHSD